jgi:methyltransferase
MLYSLQPVALLVVIVVPWLLLETWKSARQARALRAAGAIEPPDDPYRAMAVVYPGMFLAMTAEGVLAPPACTSLVATGIGVFLAGKLLKWWAILSLGRFWSFRVLVVPGAALITGGPYRWLRHPNYVGLLGEIAGVALMMRAPITGVVSALAFGALLRRRIRVEERTLAGEPAAR